MRVGPHVAAPLMHRAGPPCGKIRGGFSTGFSTGKSALHSNLHFGRVLSRLPYLGVGFGSLCRMNLHFSTGGGTYPQKIASYPQNAFQVASYGGKPCPLYIGGSLEEKGRFRQHGDFLIHKQGFGLSQDGDRITHIDVQEGAHRCELFPDVPDQQSPLPVTPLVRFHAVRRQPQGVAQE